LLKKKFVNGINNGIINGLFSRPVRIMLLPQGTTGQDFHQLIAF